VSLYRKKPVVISAELFDGTMLSADRLVTWITSHGGSASYGFAMCGEYWALYIDTLEGRHAASKGDYIIKGVADEFYPCKPDIFDKTYDEVK
jgi:hypothetical protein